MTDDSKGILMRVFLAGATGAIGTRLAPQLVAAGHEVIGTFHSPGRGARLRTLGLEPVRLDLLDRAAVRDAVVAAHPDAVIHQVTALTGAAFGRSVDRTFAATNRLRIEGTDNLIAAARAAGVVRFIAQSFASLRHAREGNWVKTEEDPLDLNPVSTTRATNHAMRYLDDAVVRAGGIALRYGGFYGAADDAWVEPVRKRQFPIVGTGAGVSSFLHLDDAAAATVAALTHGSAGTYNIVDDDPAPMREWLPALARALGARRPRHVPVWLARVLAGDAAVMMATDARGVSNAKAKRELGWTPEHASWRTGFFATYGTSPAVSTLSKPADSPGVRPA